MAFDIQTAIDRDRDELAELPPLLRQGELEDRAKRLAYDEAKKAAKVTAADAVLQRIADAKIAADAAEAAIPVAEHVAALLLLRETPPLEPRGAYVRGGTEDLRCQIETLRQTVDRLARLALAASRQQ